MKVLYIVLIAILLAGCGPSAEQMTATAVMAQAQTQTAAPTFTSTATLTLTPTQTPTSTLTPTNTPTLTPSSTATPDITSTATSKAKVPKSQGGLPGKSIANSVLQKDVLKVVLMLEPAFGCNNSKVVNTVVVKPLAQGKWAERWIMDRCGAEGSYLITFTLSPAGGVDYMLNIEK